MPRFDLPKAAAFIDGPNTHAACKMLGWNLDYKKLLVWMQEKSGILVRANYYSCTNNTNEFDPIRTLLDWLSYNGYNMISRPMRTYEDEQGNRRTKGNLDVDIAVNMLELADHVDEVYLFSGDGDFATAIDAVQRKGVRVIVVSTRRTQPHMVADIIRRKADEFIDLSDLQALLQTTNKTTSQDEKFEDNHDDSDDYEEDEDYTDQKRSSV
jgi:uncharacterized LabA/DUF88 family protein